MNQDIAVFADEALVSLLTAAVRAETKASLGIPQEKPVTMLRTEIAEITQEVLRRLAEGKLNGEKLKKLIADAQNIAPDQVT
jgi:hypothetical protein